MARRKSVPKAVREFSVKTSRVIAGILAVLLFLFTSIGFAWSIVVGLAGYGAIRYGLHHFLTRTGSKPTKRKNAR